MVERSHWNWAGTEPKLEDMLSDPIILALMRRDGVLDAELKALMAEVEQRLMPVAADRRVLDVA